MRAGIMPTLQALTEQAGTSHLPTVGLGLTVVVMLLVMGRFRGKALLVVVAGVVLGLARVVEAHGLRVVLGGLRGEVAPSGGEGQDQCGEYGFKGPMRPAAERRARRMSGRGEYHVLEDGVQAATEGIVPSALDVG